MTTVKRTNEGRTRVLALVCCLQAAAAAQDSVPASRPETQADSRPAVTLEETRQTLAKRTETQQIISKERRDWQQGKEILVGRVEVVKQEVGTLEEKIKQASSSVAEAEKKKSELHGENDKLKAVTAQLTAAVAGLEAEVRRLYTQLPLPLQTKLQPLHQRIPEDPANTKVSIAERYQNVIGILNVVNKANNEITVNFEVHELADGKPAEVKVVYVGLAQAYYLSGKGDAGIGRPTPDGWKWEPAGKEVSREVSKALEVRDGKHSPAFVPLPMKIQ